MDWEEDVALLLGWTDVLTDKLTGGVTEALTEEKRRFMTNINIPAAIHNLRVIFGGYLSNESMIHLGNELRCVSASSEVSQYAKYNIIKLSCFMFLLLLLISRLHIRKQTIGCG